MDLVGALAAQTPAWVVVVGEFKAGKSSLINALLGEERAATDVLPCTTTVQAYPKDRFALVDTPGIDEGDEEDRCTLEALDRALVALLVIRADQAATLRELDLLDRLRARAGAVTVVVNKLDVVGARDRQRLLQHVSSRVGESIPVIGLSTQGAVAGAPDDVAALTRLRTWVRSAVRTKATRANAIAARQAEELQSLAPALEDAIRSATAERDRLVRQARGKTKSFTALAEAVASLGTSLDHQAVAVGARSAEAIFQIRESMLQDLEEASPTWKSDRVQLLERAEFSRDITYAALRSMTAIFIRRGARILSATIREGLVAALAQTRSRLAGAANEHGVVLVEPPVPTIEQLEAVLRPPWRKEAEPWIRSIGQQKFVFNPRVKTVEAIKTGIFNHGRSTRLLEAVEGSIEGWFKAKTRTLRTHAEAVVAAAQEDSEALEGERSAAADRLETLRMLRKALPDLK